MVSGEANVGRDIQYESLFQGLIHDWRTQFGQPEMPFILFSWQTI